MMDIPFLIFFAERIGKPLDKFKKDDWKAAATAAALLIEELHDPPTEKKGKSRKRRNLLAESPKRPRGRPRKDVGDLPIEAISNLVDELRKPEVRARWPDAPRSREKIIERLLLKLTGSGMYAESVARRERECRKRDRALSQKRK